MFIYFPQYATIVVCSRVVTIFYKLMDVSLQLSLDLRWPCLNVNLISRKMGVCNFLKQIVSVNHGQKLQSGCLRPVGSW